MRAQQRGVTAIGWLFLLTPLAIVFYTGVRLAPIYLNYLKVSHSLDAVQSEATPESTNAKTIAISLGRQFDVQSIDYPTVKDINITRQGRSWVVDASYDDQAPLFANISIQVAFHKVVQIGNPGSEQ